MTKLTHIDDRNRPTMVDVGDKAITLRTAVAEARVRFPADIVKTLRAQGFTSKKGPIIDTAVIAGVMAAKRTHDLIPFCHPLGIENCQIDIEPDGNELVIRCQVSVHHKTGVEMEALTGAAIASLTVYDMVKALSQRIVIDGLRLIEKTGGKIDYTSR